MVEAGGIELIGQNVVDEWQLLRPIQLAEAGVGLAGVGEYLIGKQLLHVGEQRCLIVGCGALPARRDVG